MSGKATAAARRPAMSSLLQKMLSSVMDWFRTWLDLRSLLSSPPQSARRTTVALESLETRLLMSADLVGSVSVASIPDEVLPSDNLNVSVIVQNIGSSAAGLTPVVRLYASNTGQIDSNSIVLGESNVKGNQINPGKSVNVNVVADASRIDAAGNYSLFAVVDATNRVRELNETNNVALAGKPLHVAWSFGSIPGHNNAESITLRDSFGTRVTFTLTGGGRGDVVLGEDGFDLHLTGTDADSVLKITASGGRGYATLGDVLVDGSLKRIDADEANLAGGLSIGGTVRSIALGDIGDGASISIAGTDVPVKLAAGEVVGAGIHSASAFESISIEKWLPGSAGRGVISAPSIGKLSVEGAFGADLDLSGAASGLTLSKVTVDGRVTGGLWNIGGAAGQIIVKSIESPWQGSFEGAVQKIDTEQDMSGTLATPSINTLDVGRNLVGARLLIGALPDGQFGPGFIGDLNVDGAVIDSTILVGVDPVDGVYDNGNDIIVGGIASRIQKLATGGALLGTTSFTAGAFPNWVTINDRNVRSSSVPQLHTTTVDSAAPQVTLALLNDSGASAGDGETWDPTLLGNVVEAGLLASLRAAVDDFSPAALFDIEPYLQADGSFVLDEALLTAILGGPLADGVHTVHVQAIDVAGNATVQSFAFILDRTVPEFVFFDLAPESDQGIPGDRLTNSPNVAFNGLAAALTAFEVDELGISGVTNPDGTLRIENVALAEGDNHFTVRFTDLAGNQTIYLQTIRLDSIAPDAQLGLLNDTGANPADAWTNDPTIAGFVGDSGLVTSMSVAIDGGNHSEVLSLPTPGTAFQLSAAFLDQLAGGTLGDGAHTLQFAAYDTAGNATTGEFQFVLDRSDPTPPQFDLAPESDTGVAGDQHTTEALVSLTGLADLEIDLALNGVAVAPLWAGNVFRIDNVALAVGENVLTLVATDPAGNQSEFTRSIFRDEVPVEGLFPDLVVSNLQSADLGTDEFGNRLIQVTWTTSNEGAVAAQGRHGAWAESIHLSYDDTPWNGDIWLKSIKVSGPLAAGASIVHSEILTLDPSFPAGFRFYVVTDDETGVFNDVTFEYESFANEVAEKDAGEYNDLVIQDIDLGIVPAPLPASGPDLALDGTAVGGSIDMAGQTDVYAFTLDAATRLYFDALSSADGLSWSLRTAAGDSVAGASFEASDAFGTGSDNPLLALGAGNYELVISAVSGQTGAYGFRLLDPDQAAFTNLHLDGGPLLRQLLERGDWTDIYQFDATAGTHYVAGGPNDWAIDGAFYWRMFDPQGNQVWTSTTSPSDDSIFDLSGTHTLMVEGRYARTDPAMYNVYVFTPQDREIALFLNQRTEGFIDSPGQVNTYHFNLDQATVAFFDGWLESNGPHFQWSLENSGGVVASGNTRWDTTDVMGVAMPMPLDAGDYTIRIEGMDNAAGWYNFALFDILHGPAQSIPLDVPVTGDLLRGFDSTLFRFDASAGQAITVSLNPGYDPAYFDAMQWLLVDAGGNVVANGRDGAPVDVMLGDAGSYSLLLQGHQYGWWFGSYNLTVSASDQEAVVPVFDLAPESDLGTVGDHRTTLPVVNLTGVAAPGALVSLQFTPLTTTADAAGTFTFFNVSLALGENTFTVLALDSEGIETQFTRSIFRDEAPVQTGQPDLAVISIDRQVLGVNEFGELDMLVSWVTANQGSAAAHGQMGFWIENLFASQFDSIPFSGDDIFLGNIFVTEDLAGDSQRTNSLSFTLPGWIGGDARFYVVVDEGNQVFEKTSGEYNNTTVEDVPSGMAPPPIAPTGTILSLSGEATAGSINAGAEIIHTFHLDGPARLLFDALTSDPGISWELREAGGPALFSRNFADADAFGMGPINALLNAAGPGDYEVVIRKGPGDPGQYAFRLLDVVAAASHDLVLDGGALLGQTLARGDQTHVYQFEATAGQAYVVGGLADNTIEGALYWRLFNPQGNQIWSGTTEPSDVAFFQDTGTYTLVVEGRYERTDPTRYNVYVFTPQDRVIPLALGNHVQGFLDGPGQVNTYTFTLSEPAAVFFDGRLDSNGQYFEWTLEGAGGIEGQGNVAQDSGNGSDPLIHLGAGSYTLRISAQGDASGWYNFNLMDVLHDPAWMLSPGVPAQPFVYPGFDSELYRFDGTAGSQASISLSSFDPEWYTDVARWTLIDPQGNAVASGLPGPDAALVDLTATGTWTVLVQGRQASWETLAYTLTVS